MTDPDPEYGPDMFFSDVTLPDPNTVLNEPLPQAWTEGGMIEAVKRSVITGLRAGFNGSSLHGADQPYYIDIEYPHDVTQIPSIWVQFNIESLKRAGLGMGTWTKDTDGNWGEIQEWMFDGRIILTMVALTSKDRDRLADTVIAQLAFARPVDLALRDPRKDSKEKRGLIETIENSQYVSMSLNTDEIGTSGQTATQGAPWNQNILIYEDSYSMTCQGQFNLRFSHDGVYSLAEIAIKPEIQEDEPPYNPMQWRGAPGAP